MAIITPATIADLIDQAPGWARVGLTVPSERVRAEARLELGRHLYTSLYPTSPLDGQLPLPL